MIAVVVVCVFALKCSVVTVCVLNVIVTMEVHMLFVFADTKNQFVNAHLCPNINIILHTCMHAAGLIQ